jgi:hypothetical protein
MEEMKNAVTSTISVTAFKEKEKKVIYNIIRKYFC